ncbi:MAG: TraX protein [Oscillospiraceae bacterium]|nr:TraX protein [Oscillospiraceae bacterium]
MKKCISQEGLKLAACLTMLIDHIGAIFVPGYLLRCIGRVSFPIYCFLLAEGAVHTRDCKKYGLRLLLATILSELPYDLAFYGTWTMNKQSVMPTLLCGFLAVWVLRTDWHFLLKIMCAAVLGIVAEKCRADYGMEGVVLILLFYITRNMPCRWLVQAAAMLFLFAQMSSPTLYWLGPVRIRLQMLGVLAMIPIALYSGQKRTKSKAVQWGFYLFYPAHLAALHLIEVVG